MIQHHDYSSLTFIDYHIIQGELGPGYTNGSHTDPIQSGGCDILGMKSGSVDGTDNSSIIYRGVEDIFGNVWQFIDGINIKDYQAYICYDKNEYQSDQFDGCYMQLGYINVNSYEKWVSKLGYDINNPLIAFPIKTNGNDNTHMTDYYMSSFENRIMLVGGAWGDSLFCGLWFWMPTQKSFISWNPYGARLIKTS